MKYDTPEPITRAAAEAAFASREVRAISEALVRSAFHDPDWRWVQGRCLSYLGDSEATVRGVAATCLGHVARIHRRIDGPAVIPALERLASDRDVGGRAQDALDDIRMFAPADVDNA